MACEVCGEHAARDHRVVGAVADGAGELVRVCFECRPAGAKLVESDADLAMRRQLARKENWRCALLISGGWLIPAWSSIGIVVGSVVSLVFLVSLYRVMRKEKEPVAEIPKPPAKIEEPAKDPYYEALRARVMMDWKASSIHMRLLRKGMDGRRCVYLAAEACGMGTSAPPEAIKEWIDSFLNQDCVMTTSDCVAIGSSATTNSDRGVVVGSQATAVLTPEEEAWRRHQDLVDRTWCC